MSRLKLVEQNCVWSDPFPFGKKLRWMLVRIRLFSSRGL